MYVKLIVTHKGHKAPNAWKEGQEISVDSKTAEVLIARGFAVEPGSKKAQTPAPEGEKKVGKNK